MIITSSTRAALGAFLAVATLAGACSGDDDSSTEAETTTLELPSVDVNAIRAEQFCDAPEQTTTTTTEAPDDGSITLTGEPVTVVFLHGAAYRATTWVNTGTLFQMCTGGFPALAIDLPGFGDTPDTDVDNVEFMDELAAEIGTDLIVVSPSMSGSFSLPWLETAPDTAAGFIGVAPVGVDAFSPPDDLMVPALVLWGSDDQVIDVSGAQTLANKIPGAVASVVDGGDHAFYETNSAAFHRAVIEFVAALSSNA